MKNGRKPSQICLRKHLGSVTEAPRLGFSSRKQFFLPKTAEIHSQGAEGSLEQPPSAFFQEKGGGGCCPARPGELGCFLSKNVLEGPLQNFKLLFAPPNFDKFTPPSFVIYGKVTEAIRKRIGLDFLLFLSSFSPILSEICLFRVMGILRKHYGCPKSPFLNKTGEVVSTLSKKLLAQIRKLLFAPPFY